MLISGCGRCYAVDGNWKLTFPHCMFPVKTSIGLPGVNFPDVCPQQPKGNHAFCSHHMVIAESRKYPTSVKEFLHYCGAKSVGSGECYLVGLNCM